MHSQIFETLTCEQEPLPGVTALVKMLISILHFPRPVSDPVEANGQALDKASVGRTGRGGAAGNKEPGLPCHDPRLMCKSRRACQAGRGRGDLGGNERLRKYQQDI